MGITSRELIFAIKCEETGDTPSASCPTRKSNVFVQRKISKKALRKPPGGM